MQSLIDMFLSLCIEQLGLCLEISAFRTFSPFGNILNIWSYMRRNFVQQISSANHMLRDNFVNPSLFNAFTSTPFTIKNLL